MNMVVHPEYLLRSGSFQITFPLERNSEAQEACHLESVPLLRAVTTFSYAPLREHREPRPSPAKLPCCD